MIRWVRTQFFIDREAVEIIHLVSSIFCFPRPELQLESFLSKGATNLIIYTSWHTLVAQAVVHNSRAHSITSIIHLSFMPGIKDTLKICCKPLNTSNNIFPRQIKRGSSILSWKCNISLKIIEASHYLHLRISEVKWLIMNISLHSLLYETCQPKTALKANHG